MNIMKNNDVHEHIMDEVNLQDLRRYGMTCKAIHQSVQAYLRRWNNIDPLLLPYVPSHRITYFRAMQKEADAIIGGSTALQFMARVRYKTSDLDIYVERKNARFLSLALEDVGCTVINRNVLHTTAGEIYDEILTDWTKRMDDGERNERNELGGQKTYMSRGILAIVNFESYAKRKVQVVVTDGPPVDVVLKCHSSECKSLPLA